MIEMSSTVYLWVKALHIISVISWMAGLLYLPRLFVYHADCEIGSKQSETFKIMEHRLLRYIMTPAMKASFLIGNILLYNLNAGCSWWIYLKLISVLGLAFFHGIMSKCKRSFAEDFNKHSAKFFRAINEIPTILLIFIVIMAVVKPF